jgi:Ankyrin repeat
MPHCSQQLVMTQSPGNALAVLALLSCYPLRYHGGLPMWLQDLQDGCTALMLASEGGHTEVVRCLLATPGVTINAAGQVISLNDYWSSPLLMHVKYWGTASRGTMVTA